MTFRKKSLGIDLGTFHTVAVHADSTKLTFSKRSIPSVAVVIKDTPIVGFEAQRLSASATRLIVAPKLKLHDRSEPLDLIKPILRKLVDESISNLGMKEASAVLTVPPAWSINDCISIKDAVEALGFSVSFLHEPVALLAAAYYMARHSQGDYQRSGQLVNAESILVCDWGAGTVDLAFVKVQRKVDGSTEFAVLGERTEIGDGGTDLAKDIVSRAAVATEKPRVDYFAYQLQEAWQGNQLPGFDASLFETNTTSRRQEAAERISASVSKLLSELEVHDRAAILTILYGGPLESKELSESLTARLVIDARLSRNHIFNLDSTFVERQGSFVLARRDALVAAGAALYGTTGEAIPEFEYEVILRDSFGSKSSSVRLVRDRNLKGIQVVTPPFTGVDYFVDIAQLTRGNNETRPTSISGELRLHVREGAVVMYSIADAGVGFVKIQAAEAMDLPSPKLFDDSRVEELLIPEKSTRFILNI